MIIKTRKSQLPADFVERVWNESMTQVKTVVDMASEPFLMLDNGFFVIAANEAYYRIFKYQKIQVEGKSLYSLGNGEWDVPALRLRLAKVAEAGGFFSALQMTVRTAAAGSRTLMLNARNIQTKGASAAMLFPQTMILLAMEDVTDMMRIAEGIGKNLL